MIFPGLGEYDPTPIITPAGFGAHLVYCGHPDQHTWMWFVVENGQVDEIAGRLAEAIQCAIGKGGTLHEQMDAPDDPANDPVLMVWEFRPSE
jgi:hypothetical protein